MEKKVTRVQVYPNHSQSAAKFSSANNNNTVSSNTASSSFQQPDSSRQQSKGKNNNFNQQDYGNKSRVAGRSRGNRRPTNNQQNYEVNKGRREQRVTNYNSAPSGRGAETASNVAGGERKGRHSADHLLNFTYAPLPSQDGNRSARRPTSNQTWRSGGRKQPIYTKQQFLQAHCQFVVRPPIGTEYVEQMANIDRMVDWDQIEQVILSDDQIASCPICLDVPVAAKITKCAHIYCWPCILHYLSLSERAWAKCPICFDAIEENDLKSVRVRTQPKYKVGDEIVMHLMRKERDSLYVRPKSEWRVNQSDHLYSVQDDEMDVRYSKLLTSTVSQIEEIIREERRQLESLLSQEDTQSLEASYVQAALRTVSERERSVCSKRRDEGRKGTEPGDQRQEGGDKYEEESIATKIPMQTIQSDPQLRSVSYSDAFDDSISEIPADSVIETSADSVTTSPSELEESSPASYVTPTESTKQTETADNIQRRRNASSTSSSDSGESELVAADLLLPATGTQHSNHGNKRTEVYYFYQCADGQHVYLNSINTRILAAEYGSLEMAPHTITATILECEENSMSLDLRKRLKYLSHLPLYCGFTVCEVSLRPPVVSSACLSHFTEELNRRKRMRNRRTRTETKQYNKAMAEERRRMGQYPDMVLPLNSERHFPVSSPPTISEFVPLTETPAAALDEQSAVSEKETTLLRQSNTPLTTPYSFSQATLGGSGAAAPSWPRVQTQYVRSSAHTTAAGAAAGAVGGAQSDEEGAAPTFKQSFSADFDEMFSRLSTTERHAEVDREEGVDTNNTNSSPASGGGKKKKQKGKKQMVLFATSGQRGNL